MAGSGSMRKVWIGISLAVAVLSFYPAWVGRTSWWLPGIAFALFLVFVLEPWLLTWELRRRGEELQITDEGVLRRLARGDSEYVRWVDLREVSIVVTQGVNLTEEYFFVLAGSGTSGVLVGQRWRRGTTWLRISTNCLVSITAASPRPWLRRSTSASRCGVSRRSTARPA